MLVWPLWLIIGLMIFNIIAGVAMIGKETTVKYTAGRAIFTMIVNSVWIFYFIVVIQHLC